MIDFVDWLQEQMRNRDISQKELADRGGISPAQITRILKREQKPGIESLQALSRGLHLSLEVVYSAAGLLPPIEPELADIEEFREILRQLTPAEREELKRIGWLKIELKKKK